MGICKKCLYYKNDVIPYCGRSKGEKEFSYYLKVFQKDNCKWYVLNSPLDAILFGQKMTGETNGERNL